jgi:hypothetical protein
MTFPFPIFIPYVPAGGITYATVFDNAANFDADTGGWDGHTIRIRVPHSMLGGSLSGKTHLRVTLRAASAEAFGLSKLYVGHPAGAGDAWDAAALTQLLFSGASGATVPGGGTLPCDGTAFAYDGASGLIFSVHCNGGGASDGMRRDTVLTGANYYFKAAVDEAATANVSGYSTTANSLALISAIELGA